MFDPNMIMEKDGFVAKTQDLGQLSSHPGLASNFLCHSVTQLYDEEKAASLPH